MRYCKWSSNNWKCDLYCYANADGGWTTNVASSEVLGEVLPELNIAEAPIQEWLASHRAAIAFLKTAERRPIGLLYDGETFNDPTLEAFRDRLMALRRAGYRFPDYVLDEVAEEIAAFDLARIEAGKRK